MEVKNNIGTNNQASTAEGKINATISPKSKYSWSRLGVGFLIIQ